MTQNGVRFLYFISRIIINLLGPKLKKTCGTSRGLVPKYAGRLALPMLQFAIDYL
jgi:hypothetical protein